jgi:hypothetical protein
MPLQASGKIRLSDVAAQFGGSGSIKMSDYLKGGSKVANTSVNTNVASSGKQELSDYYSTGNPVVSIIATVSTSGGHYFNSTVNTVAAERGANTRLIMAGCGAAGSGNVNNQSCFITGKTVNTIYTPGNNDDGDAQNTSQYSCNLGNESSFVINYHRGISNRGARAAIIQIDNCQSVSSPTASNTTVGSAQRTISISDGQGLSVYSGQTSFDSFVGSYGTGKFSVVNSHYFRQIVASDTYMTQIFGTQNGNPSGQILYLSSLNHPTGSVTFGHKAGTDFCAGGASTCTVGGNRMCCGVAYYPF